MAKSILNSIMKRLVGSLGGQKFLHIQLDITNSCNLSCSHCYHKNHNNRGAIKYDDWIIILNEYESLCNKLYLDPVVTFCGGEPLASMLLSPLIENVNSRWPGVAINILSNGVLVTPAVAKRFKEFNITFQISIDGPNASEHDYFRGRGNFEKAIGGVHTLRENNISTLLLAILSRRTSRNISEFFALAKELNVNAMNFTRFIPLGFGSGLESSGADSALTGHDLRIALTKVLEYSKNYGVRTNTNQPLYHLLDSKLGAGSKFGFQGLVVDYRGNLKVSSRADHVLGNILSDGLENLFLESPLMKSLRRGEIETCGKCEFYRRCGGDRNSSYATSGSFLKEDPGCWIITNKNRAEA
ncbi:MAG: radical SAM protein [Bdellovibrionales bacterium]|nr:radical SAM protein [Bdellovibrionales bacterium]